MRNSIAFIIVVISFSSISFSQELNRPASHYLARENFDCCSKKTNWAGAFKSGAFKNDELRNSFWGDVNSSRSTLVSFAFDTTGSIYSELIVDTRGLWKISFAGAISSSNNDTVQNAQGFFETGGNAIIKASYPLFVVYANDTNFVKYRNAGIYFVTKFGANLPALGGYSTKFSGSIDSGIEVQGFMSTDQEKLVGFLSLRVAFATGTKDFLSEWAAKDKKVFGYGRVSTGVIFNDFIRIGINFPVHIWGKVDPIDQLPLSISTGIIF